MTLNDNPRVVAEKRLALLYGRVHRICDRYRRWIVEYDGEFQPTRMAWTGVTAEQLRKKDRVLKLAHAEIRRVEKFLKGFR